MIVEKHGNILDEPRETWVVVPVNCVGVAGAGLAKQWADRHPGARAHYVKLCRRGMFRAGEIKWLDTDDGRFILAATKDPWSQPSKMEWVETILSTLFRRLEDAEEPLAAAIPPIGCGYGGLDWAEVEALILDRFVDGGNPQTDRHTLLLYPPR